MFYNNRVVRNARQLLANREAMRKERQQRPALDMLAARKAIRTAQTKEDPIVMTVEVIDSK